MWDKKITDELDSRRSIAKSGGGAEKIEKQHASGKLTARERLDLLFDEGSFIEVDTMIESRIDDFDMKSKRIPGDGVVTGYGKIDGRIAFASSEDFTVIGGTLGEYHSLKICKILDMAMNMHAPMISINDSGGARIEEGISSLSGYSGIFLRNTMASGVIPQIAVIMGPCAGGACYSPAICDYVFMTEESSQMFITGPHVVKAVTGEEISACDLGGAKVHSEISGVAHFLYPDDEQCLTAVRQLLSYLPQNNTDALPFHEGKPQDRSYEIQDIVPDNQRKGYDVHKVIDTMVDEDSFFEVQRSFAKNIVVGLARMDGETLGVVANQPNHLSGSLDYHASDKAARFIRFCDCFNIPILTLVDVTAFLPGKTQEHNGIIRHGAKLLFAYAEATVPKISLIMRKAYGGAYIAMNSKNMGADMVFAWPIAQIAVMGAEGAVNIIFKRNLASAEDKQAEKEKLIKQYEEKFMNPYIAAARGFVDEVIQPEETRIKIKGALEMLKTKKKSLPEKKHGNIPL